VQPEKIRSVNKLINSFNIEKGRSSFFIEYKPLV